jgi:hypothetical protein
MATGNADDEKMKILNENFFSAGSNGDLRGCNEAHQHFDKCTVGAIKF